MLTNLSAVELRNVGIALLLVAVLGEIFVNVIFAATRKKLRKKIFDEVK